MKEKTVFNIGKGNDTSRSDAFTVLGHGKVGIGFDNFETSATQEKCYKLMVTHNWLACQPKQLT
jgi:hypothetical protein